VWSSERIKIILGFLSLLIWVSIVSILLLLEINKRALINKNFIIKYIFKLLEIKKKLEIDDLGYRIAPILNSAGRLENANQIIELLTTNSDKLKVKIIDRINKLNEKRKFLEKKILNQLDIKKIEKQHGVIFIYNASFHEGVIGIIASRIKDYFDKPCIVLTKSRGVIKGSARSTNNFNLGSYINKAVQKKILLSGGGHNLAAGLSLKEENIQNFKNFINSFFSDDKNSPKAIYISKISLDAVNKNFIKSINLLGPHGNKNPNPLFLLQDVKFVNSRNIKNNFLTCFVLKNKKMTKATSFHNINSHISYELQNSNNTFNLVARIKLNKWNNRNTIEIEIIDLIKVI